MISFKYNRAVALLPFGTLSVYLNRNPFSRAKKLHYSTLKVSCPRAFPKSQLASYSLALYIKLKGGSLNKSDGLTTARFLASFYALLLCARMMGVRMYTCIARCMNSFQIWGLA